MAILRFMCVHAGEVGALLNDYGDPNLGSNVTENAPSWLPRDMLGFKFPLSNLHSACSINIDPGHRLFAQAQYVPLTSLFGAQWTHENPRYKRTPRWSPHFRKSDEKMRLWLLPRSFSGLKRRKWNLDIHATVTQASADADIQ